MLLWTPFAFQSGCFPSKQHCSTQIRRDLQCREKPPTRHSAACGLRAELGAAVPLRFNCLGSSPPACALWAQHLAPCSGSAPGSGTLSLAVGLSCPWDPLRQGALEGRALPRDHGKVMLCSQLLWGLLSRCNMLYFPHLLSRDRTDGFTWSPGHGKHYRGGRADLKQ